MSIQSVDFVRFAVEKAFRQPPVPYAIGKRSDTLGTDCSNLVWWMYQLAGGKDIRAGSNSIWDSHVIDKRWCDDGGSRKYGGDLQPGDLLFIDYGEPVTRNANGTPGKMDHVGIYVGPMPGAKTPDGKAGTVVHASLSQKFVVFSEIPTSFIRWTHKGRLKLLTYDMGKVDWTNPDIRVDVPLTPDPPPSLDPGPGEVMIVTQESPGARMRKQPKIVNNPTNAICEVPRGTILPIIEGNGEWTMVPFGIHRGWIRNDLLRFG